MNNVENRIVEMKFDNSQFESAVAKTMDTLDKFKEKLNFNNAGKGMDQLGKATSNYQYTLNDIGQSLDRLNGRFSTMGIIGKRVLENLTDSAINFAKNGIGNLVSGVTKGGLSRAMNLEQAKFQLQGILKDATEVKRVIYDDILPELQGTPYSLDQAAVVIGQLGASGITASKDVRQATRAIAGLAAMSGRGFDEVGRIFSKVAGQGNMMGGELQQLSGYGINAAANISEYFTKVAKGSEEASNNVKEHIAEIIDAYGDLSEGTIREAASKRMIFYEDMASAMDALYGEHAKKSTEMYTGALEDLRAALARIGAEPAAVGLEFLRDAFNSLVPAVDAVNAVLKPFTSATKDVIEQTNGEKAFGGAMAGTLAKEVQSLGHAFQSLFVILGEDGHILRWTEEGIEKYGKTIKYLDDEGNEVVKHVSKWGQELSAGDAVMNHNMWITLTASTQSFVNILKALRNVITPIAKGIISAFPKLTLENISKMAERIRVFTEGLILSGENMERLKYITQGVFTPIGVIFRALVSLIKSFIKVMGSVFDIMGPMLGKVADYLVSISKSIIKFGDSLSKSIGSGNTFGKFISGIIAGIAHFLKLDKALSLVKTGFTKFVGLLDSVEKKVKNFTTKTTSGIKNFANSFGNFIHIDKITGGLSKLFGIFKNGFSKAFHLDIVSEGFKELTDSIKELVSTDGLFGKLIDNIKGFADYITELVPFESIAKGISGGIDKLAESIGKITKKPASALSKFFKDRAKDIGEFLKNLNEVKAFDRLAKSLIKPYATLKTTITNLKVILIPLLQTLASYIPKLFGFVSLGDMLTTIGGKIKSTIKDLLKFVGIFGEITKTQSVSKLESLRKSFQNLFSYTLGEHIININKALSSAGHGFVDKLVALGKAIGEVMRNLDEKSVRKFITMIALLALAWKYFGVLTSVKYSLDGFATLFTNVGGLLGQFKSAFGIATINSAIAKTIRLVGLASSLVIFASAVYILSKMKWDQILLGSAVIGGALFAFWSILKVLDKMDVSDGKGRKVTSLAISIAAISGGVLMMALAIKQVASVWDKDDPDKMVAAVLSIIAIMAAFAVVSKVLGGIEGNAKSLGKASFALIGMAQGMKMMAEAFKEFSSLNKSALKNGLKTTVAIMGLFVLFAAAVKPGAKVFSASMGLMAIAGAMIIMQKALAAFGNMKPEVIEQGGKALGTIIIALMGFAAIVGRAESSILAGGIGMLAIAAAIQIIRQALESIGKLDQKVFENGSAAIVAILAAFVLFAKFAGGGGSMGAAVSILLLAAGIHILVAAIEELASLNFGTLLAGLIKMGVVAIGLAASIFVLNGALKLIGAGDAVKVTLLGAGLYLLAGAIGTLASVPIAAIALAIIALVGALALAGVVMGLFTGISPALLAVGAAFALLGVSALFVGAGLLFLTLAITALVPLIFSLSMLDTDALAAGLDVIKQVAVGLADAFIALAKGVVVFGLACLVAGVGLFTIGAGLAIIGLGATVASLGVALLAGALAMLAVIIQKFFGSGLLETISNAFTTFTEGFTGLFGRLWEKIVGTSETKSKETGEKTGKGLMDGTIEGVESEKDNLNKTIQDGPKEALDDINDWGPKAFGEGGEGLNSAFGAGFLGDGTTPIDMSGIKDQFGIDIDNLDELAGDGGYSIMSSISDGENKGIPLVDGSTGKLIKGLDKKLGNLNYRDSGLKVPKTFAQGEDGGRSLVTTATGKIESAATPSVSTGPGSTIYSVGYSIAQGLAKGIDAGSYLVVSAANSAVDDAIAAAKNRADVNSPSRRTIPIGSAIAEGFVVGMNRMSGAVKKAGTELSEETIQSVDTAMSKLAAAFDSDLDFTPTITPVVDLTNVRQSADGIDSILGGPYNLSTPSSNFLLAQSAALGMKNSRDEFDAINKLANKIGEMNETMNSRSLNVYNTIDGSENPELFAEQLVRGFRLNARTI